MQIASVSGGSADGALLMGMMIMMMVIRRMQPQKATIQYNFAPKYQKNVGGGGGQVIKKNPNRTTTIISVGAPRSLLRCVFRWASHDAPNGVLIASFAQKLQIRTGQAHQKQQNTPHPITGAHGGLDRPGQAEGAREARQHDQAPPELPPPEGLRDVTRYAVPANGVCGEETRVEP